VHTPVGARCRQCANVRRLPQYNISAAYLARGAGAALVTGLVLGGLWGVLLPFGVSYFLGLLVGLGLGYAIGEAVSFATNRKLGLPLQVLAVGGVVVAYLAHAAVLVSSIRGVSFHDVLTRDTFGYVVVILAAVVAMGRVR
jgi:hypothetical protein